VLYTLFWNRLICFFVLLLVANPVLSDDAGGPNKELTFEMLGELREKGLCGYSISEIEADRRELSIIFLEDVLLGVTDSGDSFTRRLVGNINIFKIGRDVSPTLLRLYDYADRSDVRNQIKSDLNDIPSTQDFMERDLPYNPLEIFFCEMHKMLSGESFYFEREIDSYLQDLSKRMMHQNIKKLNDILDDTPH
tara:strand:- start:764 stop:1342 length:579 start_codon:yes stop_codon:yes gene_type:complete